jgi:hypothetical protein
MEKDSTYTGEEYIIGTWNYGNNGCKLDYDDIATFEHYQLMEKTLLKCDILFF